MKFNLARFEHEIWSRHICATFQGWNLPEFKVCTCENLILVEFTPFFQKLQNSPSQHLELLFHFKVDLERFEIWFRHISAIFQGWNQKSKLTATKFVQNLNFRPQNWSFFAEKFLTFLSSVVVWVRLANSSHGLSDSMLKNLHSPR